MAYSLKHTFDTLTFDAFKWDSVNKCPEYDCNGINHSFTNLSKKEYFKINGINFTCYFDEICNNQNGLKVKLSYPSNINISSFELSNIEKIIQCNMAGIKLETDGFDIVKVYRENGSIFKEFKTHNLDESYSYGITIDESNKFDEFNEYDNEYDNEECMEYNEEYTETYDW